MTTIEWTHAPGFTGCTWNPVIGCRHVAEGCRHCYAETMSKRLAAMGQKDYASILDAKGKFNGRAITRPDKLAEPLGWKKPRMVFVNSMSDLFHEDVPFEFIAAVFGVMAACPQHTFQVLTKRPERALEFFEWAEKLDTPNGGGVNECVTQMFGHEGPNHALTKDDPDDIEEDADCKSALLVTDPPEWPLKNVWLGVSIATQADADKNIPVLLKCPAAVRFVSAEPLIEAVDFVRAMPCEDCGGDGFQRDANGREHSCELCGGDEDSEGHGLARGLHWVIVGGESGSGARACKIDWVRNVVAQCKAAEVPVFVKQLGVLAIYHPNNAAGVRHHKLKDKKGGDPSEWPSDLRVREFPVLSGADGPKQEPAHA
jgi:protein gp37